MASVSRPGTLGVRMVSMFAGVGGFDLGFERAGIATVWQCEIDEFCTTILAQHWPHIPRAGDIREVPPHDVPRADVWTCGFPCKTCHSPATAHGPASKDAAQGCFTLLRSSLRRVAPRLSSSRMLRAFSLRTPEATSGLSSRRWPTSGMAWRGACLTVDTSGWPSLAVESSFADLLETRAVPERHVLSPNAATGILRRCDAMGRNLFPPLREALETLAAA